MESLESRDEMLTKKMENDRLQDGVALNSAAAGWQPAVQLGHQHQLPELSAIFN
jgi:hypothetical protein